MRTNQKLQIVAAGVGLAVAVAGLLLLTSKPTCASRAASVGGAQLVVTAGNRNCVYPLRVGETFAVINSGADAWGSWPPMLSNPSQVIIVDQSVGSPDPVWEIDYRAKASGDLILAQHAITIAIRP